MPSQIRRYNIQGIRPRATKTKILQVSCLSKKSCKIYTKYLLILNFFYHTFFFSILSIPLLVTFSILRGTLDLALLSHDIFKHVSLYFLCTSVLWTEKLWTKVFPARLTSLNRLWTLQIPTKKKSYEAKSGNGVVGHCISQESSHPAVRHFFIQPHITQCRQINLVVISVTISR